MAEMSEYELSEEKRREALVGKIKEKKNNAHTLFQDCGVGRVMVATWDSKERLRALQRSSYGESAGNTVA